MLTSIVMWFSVNESTFNSWILCFINETSINLCLSDCFTEDLCDFNNLIANSVLLRYTVRIQVILFWILRWQSDEQYTVNSYCWPKLILFWKINSAEWRTVYCCLALSYMTCIVCLNFTKIDFVRFKLNVHEI